MILKNIKYLLKKKKRFFIKEKIYNYKDICFNHLFLPVKQFNQLLVVSPAFGGKGDEIRYQLKYNYLEKLKNFNCHKLFILDAYHELPSYCLSNYRDEDYEKALVYIIDNICKKYKISSDNIVTFDSSEGGFCAFYYAIKYNFGYCLATVCQTKVDAYLFNSKSLCVHKVLKNITGEDNFQEANLLDSWIYNIFQKSDFTTKIIIHISVGDNDYSEHIVPFVNLIDVKRKKVVLDIHHYIGHEGVLKHIDGFIDKYLKSLISLN